MKEWFDFDACTDSDNVIGRFCEAVSKTLHKKIPR